MSYEKQTWETGDIVTSGKLNHMEDGIAESDILIAHLNKNNGTLDISWQGIFDALASGKNVCILDVDNENLTCVQTIVYSAAFNEADLHYFIYCLSTTGIPPIYRCTSANEYPVIFEDET